MIPESALNPGEDIDRLFVDLRRVMLLNAAVVVTITMGLAGITLLVRRRTDHGHRRRYCRRRFGRSGDGCTRVAASRAYGV